MFKKSQLPLILATAFLDILGMSLLIPLLPSIIGAFGVNESWSGYSQAIYAIGMFIGGLFFGKWSDKYGRKKMLSYTSILNLTGMVLLLWSIWHLSVSATVAHHAHEAVPISVNGLSGVFANIGPAFILFLVARFIGGLGGAGFGVVGAYIADISPHNQRTRNMGLMGAAFGTAFLIGPAFSGMLSSFGVSTQGILMVTIFLIAINVLLIWTVLQEPKRSKESEELESKPLQLSRNIIVLLSLSLGASFAFAAIQAMSGQFYADKFNFNAAQIGYTMTLVGFVSVMYQGWLVKYVRAKFHEIQMIHIAFAILFIAFLGFSFNQSAVWLFFWVALFPLGMGSFNPSLSSLLSKSAGSEVGRMMGYNTSIQSIGNIFGPLVAGMLYFHPGSNVPFLLSTAIFLILFGVSFLLKAKQ